MANTRYDNKFEEMKDHLKKDPAGVLDEYRNIIDKSKSILEIWYDIEKNLVN